MICLAPMLALLAVVTLQPNRHHITDMDGVQIEAQSCDLEWIRSIVQQCHGANIPVFVKQLGRRWFDDVARVVVPGAQCSTVRDGRPLTWVMPHDVKSGDWSDSEFPEDLKLREWPR